MSPASLTLRRSLARGSLVVCLAVGSVLATVLPQATARAETAASPDHLVVSEVVTGGASASDELIELYNPTAAPLPLEGLELIYVSASGATISRRTAWALDAPTVPAGGHVLVANELGIYAAISDAVYASGMAATGGSVALRIQGAATAIDAVGWGTAASTWMEGVPAPAPPAGSSIERLPGGALGSSQDTDDNALDFAVRSVPDPQNSGSPPRPDPTATPPPTLGPTPSASSTASASPTPSGTVSPTPDVTVLPIATARALPDGSDATIQGTALTGSTFTDGGGYVADDSAGIAVLVTGATFERGELLRLTGELDDRFAQRTLRVDAGGLARLGAGIEPAPMTSATGAIGESLEGQAVRVEATILGSGSALTTGIAFDFDDGSGVVRLVVPTVSGIDPTGWGAGTNVELVGIVGQRDSSGTGVSGYRLQPRDPADVIRVGAPSGPTPAPSESVAPEVSPTPSPGPGVVSVAAARELPKNTRTRVQGTVTLARGIVDGETAVIQDASGAILLRLGDEVGPLSRGEVVEVEGARSTKSGMETLRVTAAPRRLGSAALPPARSARTGQAGEALEAIRVSVRGGLVAAARQASSGSVSFEIDDGSGPLRVFIGASLAGDFADLEAGTWVEVQGALGQETTGTQPLRGYRVWLGHASDLRVLATAADAMEGGSDVAADGGTGSGGAGASLDALDDPASAADPGLVIGATLVSGPWPELGLGGLLWDGIRLVGVEPESGARVEAVLGARRVPVALEITGLRAVGTDAGIGIRTVAVPAEPGSLAVGAAAPTPPSTTLPSDGDDPRWVSLVGRIVGSGSSQRLHFSGQSIRIDQRCDRPDPRPPGMAGVVGIAVADAGRLIVPCGGIGAAPALGRSAPPPVARPAEAATASLAGLPGSVDAPRPMPAAAMLLGLAAVLLGGGAVAARRFGAPTVDDPTLEAGDEAAPSEAAPPALTLVPLPRERAP